MKSQEITIINKLGLHARAAAKLVNLASRYQSSVLLEKSGYQVNGKSIMGVMMLAASKDSKLLLIIDGSDEEDALNALCGLIDDRFEEAE